MLLLRKLILVLNVNLHFDDDVVHYCRPSYITHMSKVKNLLCRLVIGNDWELKISQETERAHSIRARVERELLKSGPDEPELFKF